mgnify:CR=1 FL=1
MSSGSFEACWSRIREVQRSRRTLNSTEVILRLFMSASQACFAPSDPRCFCCACGERESGDNTNEQTVKQRRTHHQTQHRGAVGVIADLLESELDLGVVVAHGGRGTRQLTGLNKRDRWGKGAEEQAMTAQRQFHQSTKRRALLCIPAPLSALRATDAGSLRWLPSSGRLQRILSRSGSATSGNKYRYSLVEQQQVSIFFDRGATSIDVLW